MNKRSYRICIVLLLVLITITVISCKKDLKNEGGSFDFSLEFNFNGDDVFSTFDDSLKVNTIEGYKTIKLILSDEELHSIKQYIIDNNILNEDYSQVKNSIVISPSEQCTLFVMMEGEEHIIEWTSNDLGLFSIDTTTGKTIPSTGNEESYKKIMKLFELSNLIENAIYSHIETKGLPDHIGYQ